MILIIAEKPEVAKDIATSILTGVTVSDGCYTGTKDGQEYKVTSAFGHLLRLADPEEMDPVYKSWDLNTLPIFFPNWKKRGSEEAYKKKRLNQIKELLKTADQVICAGDPDDEGQLLIDELLDYFHYKKPALRVFVNDNMPENIRKEFKKLKPNSDYVPLGKAANARQIADMCFGVNETRLAALKLGLRGISIGRVQTPTLGLVVARDELISSHKKTPYYELTAFTDSGIPFQWNPAKEYLEEIESKVVTDRNYAEGVRDEVQDGFFHVVTTEKEKITPPPLPYNLTVLQSDMNRRYGLSMKQTLEITQSLRSKKAITYNRSDSQYLKEEHFADAPDLFATILNGELPDKYHMNFRIHSAAFNDANVTAHHGIIPQKNNIDLSTLTAYEKKVYMAIVDRYAMQFMPPEKSMVSTSVFTVEYGGHTQTFIYKATKVTDPGYTKYFGKTKETDSEDESDDGSKPYINAGEWNTVITDTKIIEKETKPPAHYTEGTLAKDMASIAKYVTDPVVKDILKRKDDGKKGEHGSIGTVATRSAIVETLLSRGFLERDGKYILSTEYGRNFFHVLPDSITKADTTAWWWLIQEDIKDGKETDVNAVAKSVLEEFNKHKDTAYTGKTFTRYATKEKVSGTWMGKPVTINREWGTYRFSDEELEQLFRGETITITYTAEGKSPQPITGKLAEQTYKGRTFVGFAKKETEVPDTHAEGVWKKNTIRIKRKWGEHTFTDEELEALFSGKEISFPYTSKSGKDITITGKLARQKFKGTSYVGFQIKK